MIVLRHLKEGLCFHDSWMCYATSDYVCLIGASTPLKGLKLTMHRNLSASGPQLRHIITDMTSASTTAQRAAILPGMPV